MNYSARHTRQTTVGSTELAGLFLVVSASVAAFWFVGQRIGLDLAPLVAIPSQLGMYDQMRQVPIAGYAPASRSATSSPSEAATPLRAATCLADAAPIFELDFAELSSRLGPVMGYPLECAHPMAAGGDVQQRTSAGLAYCSQSAKAVVFTNGWQHWALRNGALVTWDGKEPDPPVSAVPA